MTDSTSLSAFVLDEIQSIVGRSPCTSTKKVHRWERTDLFPSAVERRGIKAVNVWIPHRLAAGDLPAATRIYHSGEGRNSNLPESLRSGACACVKAMRQNIERIRDVIRELGRASGDLIEAPTEVRA